MMRIAQIACARCGRLPGTEAVIVNPGGRYLPFQHLQCKRCGGVVDWVCQGNEEGCDVREGICIFHGCFVAGAPRVGFAREFARRLRIEQRLEDNRSGLVDSPGEDAWPTGGGIFFP